MNLNRVKFLYNNLEKKLRSMNLRIFFPVNWNYVCTKNPFFACFWLETKFCKFQRFSYNSENVLRWKKFIDNFKWVIQITSRGIYVHSLIFQDIFTYRCIHNTSVRNTYDTFVQCQVDTVNSIVSFTFSHSNAMQMLFALAVYQRLANF